MGKQNTVWLESSQFSITLLIVLVFIIVVMIIMQRHTKYIISILSNTLRDKEIDEAKFSQPHSTSKKEQFPDKNTSLAIDIKSGLFTVTNVPKRLLYIVLIGIFVYFGASFFNT